MATTYALDADITNRDPYAATINGASSDFSRLRTIAYNEIGRRLWRRSPRIAQSTLGIVADLTESEIRYVLYQLYFEASSRTGDDVLWQKAQAFKREFEAEIASVPLAVADVPSMDSSPVRRS
jgi:hypothetical protein